MIQSDTIKLLNDSSKVITTDSLLKADTLSGFDSSQMVDTLKAVLSGPSAYFGIPHPTLPETNPWVFGILVTLFLLFVISIFHSASMLSETAKNFFRTIDRTNFSNKTTISNFRFRFFLIQFSIGAISLYAYLYFLSSNIPFSILKYGYFFLVTNLFFAIKSMLFNLIGYVFFDSKTVKLAKQYYFDIFSLFGVILYPLLLFQLYLPYNIDIVYPNVTLGIFLLAYLLLTIKLFQLFFHKIVASFYILLYLCTLEFLPLFALYNMYCLIK